MNILERLPNELKTKSMMGETQKHIESAIKTFSMDLKQKPEPLEEHQSNEDYYYEGRQLIVDKNMRQEPPDTNEEVEKTLDAQLQAGLNNNGPSNIQVKKEATDTRPVDVSNILDSVGSLWSESRTRF